MLAFPGQHAGVPDPRDVYLARSKIDRYRLSLAAAVKAETRFAETGVGITVVRPGGIEVATDGERIPDRTGFQVGSMGRKGASVLLAQRDERGVVTIDTIRYSFQLGRGPIDLGRNRPVGFPH